MRIAEATWKTGLVEQPSEVKQISKIKKCSENTSLVDVNKVIWPQSFLTKPLLMLMNKFHSSLFRKTQTCVH